MQTYLNNITILDIAIVIVHLVICISIGFYHFKNVKTAQDFFTVKASKILPSILVCTIFATAIGGGTILGYVDEIYKNSVVLFFIVTQPFLWIITSKIIIPSIYKFKDCTTLPQIMHKLFGNSGKFISICSVIIDCIGATSLQVLAFGSICQYFFILIYFMELL